MVDETSGIKIAAIVWQVPATGVSIEYDAAAKNIYPGDILYIANPYDQCAVAEAIRIRNTIKNSSVTVITAGPQRVQSMLRNHIAMGADAAIHLSGQTESCDVYDLCSIISGTIKNGGYDLVLCGEETIDNFGCVAYPGPFLSGLLGLPQISGVTKLDINTNEITAQRKMEYGDREVVRCPLPCVVAVEKSINEPGYPAFPDLLASARKEIQTLDIAKLAAADTGIAVNTEKNRSFTTPRKRVKKTITIDTSLSAANRMKMIMSGGLSQKNDRQILTGDTQKMARDILSILKNRGIIR